LRRQLEKFLNGADSGHAVTDEDQFFLHDYRLPGM
jgi:hypothetical protein